MKAKCMTTKYWLPAIGLCSMVLSGCLFGGTPEPTPELRPTISMKCADLTPAQTIIGDSLVNLAMQLQAADVEMMVSQKQMMWENVDVHSTHEALALYDQALAQAPGHCGAVFGRALAQSQLLLQDKDLNEVVDESLTDSVMVGARKASAKVSHNMPVAQAFKSSREDAASLVLRVASGLPQVNKPYITVEQDRLANEVLPKLDSIIASLNAVMAKENFTATYERYDGGVLEIDAGEVGPVLGGLKVARALLLVVIGYQWDIDQNGSYAWVDGLSTLNSRDFENLTSSQKANMDHFTGLFKTGSPFSKVKPAWKKEILGIPALLQEAVDNTIAGLKYSLSEASNPEKQVNDIYRVGTGENDDVDPADINGLIDALERTRKYLRGEVTMSYNYGTETLKINFPKIFAMDGLQNFLPYHTVRPYKEWVVPMSLENDYGYKDWSSSLRNGVASNRILGALKYSNSDAINFVYGEDNTILIRLSEENNGWFNNAYEGAGFILAELTPTDEGCNFNYEKFASRERVRIGILNSPQTFATRYETTQGTLSLDGVCRTSEGYPEYLNEDDNWKPQPFYFTDASGKKTVEIEDIEGIVENGGVGALQGKIVFPDPTFGGVFPELTNSTIWKTIKSLEHVQPRTIEDCAEVSNPDWNNDYTNEYMYDYDYRWKCTRTLPKNPSDLDVWTHYLFWLDDIL